MVSYRSPEGLPFKNTTAKPFHSFTALPLGVTGLKTDLGDHKASSPQQNNSLSPNRRFKKQTEEIDPQWEGITRFPAHRTSQEGFRNCLEWEKKRHQAERAALLSVLTIKCSPSCDINVSVLLLPGRDQCRLFPWVLIANGEQNVPPSITGMPNLRPPSCAKGLERGWFGLGVWGNAQTAQLQIQGMEPW